MEYSTNKTKQFEQTRIMRWIHPPILNTPFSSDTLAFEQNTVLKWSMHERKNLLHGSLDRTINLNSQVRWIPSFKNAMRLLASLLDSTSLSSPFDVFIDCFISFGKRPKLFPSIFHFSSALGSRFYPHLNIRSYIER